MMFHPETFESPMAVGAGSPNKRDVLGGAIFILSLAFVATAASVVRGNDPLPTKIYWGDSTGKILRSDVTGGPIEEILATSTIPQAMSIDPLHRKIYWSNASDGSVHRANLDGTGAEMVLSGMPSGNQRDGLAIEPFGMRLYFTQLYQGEFGRSGVLAFVDLPDTNPQFIGGNYPNPTHDVALHLPSNSVYWLKEVSVSSQGLASTLRADILPYPYDNQIDQMPIVSALVMTIDATRNEVITGTSSLIRRYSHLGGSSVGFSPGNTPTSITNDPFDGEGRLYWTSADSGQIKRSNRWGTVIETLHSGLPQPGPIAVVRSVDCNNNGIEDICDISCGAPGGPCDVPGCGTAADCDRDNLLDVCEPFLDCNSNGIDDRCDLGSGTSTDCNLNLVPDECDDSDCNGNGKPDTCDLADETSADCNHNNVPDECDVAGNDCNQNQIPDSCEPDCNGNSSPDDCDVASGSSPDCNASGRPDECELTGNDCNGNGIPDVCDVTAGTSTDCDSNSVPDECEVAGHDCNGNGIHDACDIASGLSQDENGDGWPDECVDLPPDAPWADPSGISKCRFISFGFPIPEAGAAEPTALRIWMISLHNVNPPYAGGPTVPFSLFNGQAVWVGPPGTYTESSSNPTAFHTSRTQCTPYYQDWSTVGLLHVTGSHIVPSSIYRVEQVSLTMQTSPPLEVRTTRWGDVEIPFNPPSPTSQPDLADVGAIVNKFRGAQGAPIKARVVITPSNPFGEITTQQLTQDVDFQAIASSVNAFRGSPYPAKMGKCAGSSAACSTHAECGSSGPCNLYCPD